MTVTEVSGEPVGWLVVSSVYYSAVKCISVPLEFIAARFNLTTENKSFCMASAFLPPPQLPEYDFDGHVR